MTVSATVGSAHELDSASVQLPSWVNTLGTTGILLSLALPPLAFIFCTINTIIQRQAYSQTVRRYASLDLRVILELMQYTLVPSGILSYVLLLAATMKTLNLSGFQHGLDFTLLAFVAAGLTIGPHMLAIWIINLINACDDTERWRSDDRLRPFPLTRAYFVNCRKGTEPRAQRPSLLEIGLSRYRPSAIASGHIAQPAQAEIKAREKILIPPRTITLIKAAMGLGCYFIDIISTIYGFTIGLILMWCCNKIQDSEARRLTPSLADLPKDVWTKWPHLNRHTDSALIDRMKRHWDARFVVLRGGITAEYGHERLANLVRAVTGMRDPTWENIYDMQDGLEKMADRMLDLRDELFVEYIAKGVKTGPDGQSIKFEDGTMSLRPVA
ncbi:hypothetical protein LTR37_019298 [Vermiconidia calcicola]|uniref:Uncharacterized protein n=1 Tax=Vermiconidia calcicola TaxID=1690605 RepID=A0ACC3MFQ6_9PEZI|nr:hypothetical protein LTR37_019298 [Vermiconidia calcicola]